MKVQMLTHKKTGVSTPCIVNEDGGDEVIPCFSVEGAIDLINLIERDRSILTETITSTDYTNPTQTRAEVMDIVDIDGNKAIAAVHNGFAATFEKYESAQACVYGINAEGDSISSWSTIPPGQWRKAAKAEAPLNPFDIDRDSKTSMIGFSLSMCIKDILEGKVKISDVMFIQTNCNPICEEDVQELIEMYCKTYWRKDPDAAKQIFNTLRNDENHPRIGWASVFQKTGVPIYWGHWLSIRKSDSE